MNLDLPYTDSTPGKGLDPLGLVLPLQPAELPRKLEGRIKIGQVAGHRASPSNLAMRYCLHFISFGVGGRP